MAASRRPTKQVVRDVAIYARLSVSKDESVSIARQLDSARQYAEARNWRVVLEAVDDGVSAARVKPEHRLGWRSILESDDSFQAVIVWKTDRLARRVLDFLNADETLQKRGAGLVAVDDPIDMTTSSGRALATMLAVFAEMEVEVMQARATASREAILRAGRRAGGRPPFGWMNVANPSGPGKVLAKDPERIGAVAELASRALRGDSLYSMARWLEASGFEPRSRASADSKTRPRVWHDASVEAVLRSPTLAGMVAFRGDVLRGDDGLPVTDDALAVIKPSERREMLTRIDSGKRPGTRSRSGTSPALLYGLARCGTCDGLMYRATAAKKYAQYRCQHRSCPRQVGISRPALEAHVTAIFLQQFGHLRHVVSEDVTPSEDAARLVEIEAAVDETFAALRRDGADSAALVERLDALKEERRKATEPSRRSGPTFKVTGELVREVWRQSEGDVERQRDLLRNHLESVKVGVGGGRGRAFDPTRIQLVWKQLSEEGADRLKHLRSVLAMRAWDHLPQASAEELAEWQRESDERSRS